MSSEHTGRVLEERARLLSQPLRDEADEHISPFLIFSVSTERYAVELSRVSAINPPAPIAHVPGVHGSWAGVVSFRGLLYPVLDLGRLLGLSPPEKQVAAFVVFSGPWEMAAASEEPPYIVRLQPGTIRPALSGSRTDLISGVTDDLVSVLDLEALMEETRSAWSGDDTEGER